MEKYSAECYSWFKFLHVQDLTENVRGVIYQAICENKLTMTELFFLSNFELEEFFGRVGNKSYFKMFFHELQRVNKLNLRKEFENIWRDTFIIPWTNGNYPQKIKQRLGVNAPPIFFGRGHLPLVNNRNIAVLGSEEVTSEEIKLTWRIGTHLARHGYNVLSNHTWGIAEHAHKSALRADGTTTCVLSKGFGDFTVRSGIRDFGWQINSLFLSPYLHSQSSNTETNIERAELLVVWSDAVIVIKSDFQKDKSTKSEGNIAAALFALKNDIPVFIPAKKLLTYQSSGNTELFYAGAQEFAHPKNITNSLLKQNVPA